METRRQRPYPRHPRPWDGQRYQSYIREGKQGDDDIVYVHAYRGYEADSSERCVYVITPWKHHEQGVVLAALCSALDRLFSAQEHFRLNGSELRVTVVLGDDFRDDLKYGLFRWAAQHRGANGRPDIRLCNVVNIDGHEFGTSAPNRPFFYAQSVRRFVTRVLRACTPEWNAEACNSIAL